MTIQNILVPVDYSDCSRAALHFAAELAQSWGATLDIVHAWDKPSYVSNVRLTTPDVGSGTSLLRLIQENAQHDLDEFVKSAEVPGDLNAVARLVSGEPASSLLAELQRGVHHLVVIGTHGHTGLVHMLLGSITEKVVRHSPVPVVTVRAETERVQIRSSASAGCNTLRPRNA